jgi:hypothetical protein
LKRPLSTSPTALPASLPRYQVASTALARSNSQDTASGRPQLSSATNRLAGVEHGIGERCLLARQARAGAATGLAAHLAGPRRRRG